MTDANELARHYLRTAAGRSGVREPTVAALLGCGYALLSIADRLVRPESGQESTPDAAFDEWGPP